MMDKDKKQAKTHSNHGHRERLRKRYIDHGLDALSDHEVIELLLFYSLRQGDTKDLAKSIIEKIGGLHDVFEAHPHEIMQRTGLSEVTAALLSLPTELFKRYNRTKAERKNFRNSAELGEYAQSLFIGELQECVYLICFDNKMRLIRTECVARGTADRAEIYPREVIRTAVRYNTSFVALAHNHPSGDAQISQSDIAATSKLKQIMEDIDIDVVDHIIVAGNDFVSFAERGMMGMIGIRRQTEHEIPISHVNFIYKLKEMAQRSMEVADEDEE